MEELYISGYVNTISGIFWLSRHKMALQTQTHSDKIIYTDLKKKERKIPYSLSLEEGVTVWVDIFHLWMWLMVCLVLASWIYPGTMTGADMRGFCLSRNLCHPGRQQPPYACPGLSLYSDPQLTRSSLLLHCVPQSQWWGSSGRYLTLPSLASIPDGQMLDVWMTASFSLQDLLRISNGAFVQRAGDTSWNRISIIKKKKKKFMEWYIILRNMSSVVAIHSHHPVHVKLLTSSNFVLTVKAASYLQFK